ncbi:MAG: hypothetical protein COT81_03610 [Candidatus Buchananbacteria bacterium CG10_big_fil_rev_8_21_14_0_10_42_9]|uniref:DEAD/DEAH box helicase n=1 Tax=Candidatus Buchananbacteria bacterium CG10_big_fil_rev_8_21_14_0_10_42_9 TaxID=1974526 RepID=A0A2H0W0U4_9BACT|nr:MAG: hypothetical protein COT81_03610 [Candidatus Buchananbacteria bacterium CG10_big_fil_rev_8_21_14_0_10_42_9]
MTQTAQITSKFSELGIGEKFLAVLAQKGFNIPTPIQHQVIPSALDGKDVVGIAQTGTGKTLAFGIPMIQRIARHHGQGLILVPTRELALQVEQALKDIGAPLGLRSSVIIGGASQQEQIKSLKRTPHIVIATPGRLVDLMDQGLYKLNQVKIVTLDEADRMLDIGFLPQIKRVLQTVPKERQTMLFSATMPKAISALASAFMKLPLRIEIAPQGTAAENIEQEVFVVSKNDKMRLLDSLLQKYANDKVLIFSRTKYGAKRIAQDIRQLNHTATEIHSNRSQTQRQAALSGFTKGKFRVMVATDIAARGIDVQDISLVINFDLPDNSEDYVHRIGRTGRIGKYGKAISFVTPPEKSDIKKIERLIRKTLPVLALPALPPGKAPSSRTNGTRFQKPRPRQPHNRRKNSYQKDRPRSPSKPYRKFNRLKSSASKKFHYSND